jgi:hypothetical protein
MRHRTARSHNHMSIGHLIKVANMQGNHRQLKGCGAKRRFGCQEAAEEFLIDKELTTEMHSYKCDYCRFWHIGHPKKTIPPAPPLPVAYWKIKT